MKDTADNLVTLGAVAEGPTHRPPASSPHRLFDQGDWLSFWLTTCCVATVYFYTLAPEVTLEWSGTLSTGAMYASGPAPPGFPLWTLYAWMFTKLVPFSTIAWRIAVSSAVAGALACGMIALTVSRGS